MVNSTVFCLQAKIDKDEYGLIGRNGVVDRFDTHFRTHFTEEVGFLEYYILEENVLSRDEIAEKMATPEYDTSFTYPDNLRSMLEPMVNVALGKKGFVDIDTNKVLDVIFADKLFQAEAKISWWGTSLHLDENRDFIKDSLYIFISNYIDEMLDRNPNWLTENDMAKKFTLPEELYASLVDAIYDVYKRLRKPVINAANKAHLYLSDKEFQKAYAAFEAKFAAENPDYKEVKQEFYNVCVDFMKAKEISMMKKNYPEGTRIILLEMGDDPRPIAPNTRGTVDKVDDIGTIHCRFDDGRYLGIVPGEDSFRKLTPMELSEEMAAKEHLKGGLEAKIDNAKDRLSQNLSHDERGGQDGKQR